MNAYDRLLAAGLAQLGKQLGEAETPNSETEEILGLVSNLSFPALLGFSASAERARPKLGDDLINAVAGRLAELEEVRDLGLGAEDLNRILGGLLRRQGSPAELLEDPAVPKRVLGLAASQLCKEAGFEISEDEAREIAELLTTGEFFTDVGGMTAAALHTVRGIPVALVDDAKNSWLRVVRLPLAVLRDLSGAPIDAATVVIDLLDGDLDKSPAVLGHTLRSLYGFATLASTVKMIRALISPDNQTVRLAIVLYARANGIPITSEDLDVLHDGVFDLENPDLGPALVAAWGRLEDRVGGEKAKTILARLAERKV